jgi:hypothetical protein
VAAVTTASVDWTVAIEISGRTGTVTYRQGPQTPAFSWEMGPGRIMAFVSGPPRDNWDRVVPWAAGRREEVMRRVAEEVVRQFLRRSVAEFSDDYSAIVFTKRARAR